MQKEFNVIISKIRDHINRMDSQYIDISDKRKWNRYCASIYAIEDAQCAIDSYCNSEFPTEKHNMYLYLYGLMQALFIQQDAGSGLLDSLEIGNVDTNPVQKQNEKLKEIREIRNYVVGHITEIKRKDSYAYVQINQGSIKKFGFHYFLYSQDNDFKSEDKYVDLRLIIDIQYEEIMKILKKLYDAMNRKYEEFLQSFDKNQMENIFKDLEYANEKIRANDYLAESGMRSVQSMISKCKQELDKRFGSWEREEEFKITINDAEDLITLRGKTEYEEFPSNVKKYLTELLLIKVNHLKELAVEQDALVQKNLAELKNSKL